MKAEKTCKLFHQLVSDKHIWETAVLSMCRHNGLFEPSYPIESMGVTDLQKAAFGPILFNRRIRRLHASQHGAIPTLHPCKTELSELIPNTCAELIPGGRYLLAGQSFSGSIELWGLGIAGPFYRIHPHPTRLGVTKFTVEGTGFEMEPPIPIKPHPGEKILRFLASVKPTLSEPIRLSVITSKLRWLQVLTLDLLFIFL